MTDLDRHAEIGRRVAEATQRNDQETFRDLADPDVVVWHNFDEREVGLDHMLGTLDGLHGSVEDLEWSDSRVTATAEGYVWRAVLTGTGPGGPFRAPTCVVATVSELGLVTRIDEYLDTAQLAALTG